MCTWAGAVCVLQRGTLSREKEPQQVVSSGTVWGGADFAGLSGHCLPGAPGTLIGSAEKATAAPRR